MVRNLRAKLKKYNVNIILYYIIMKLVLQVIIYNYCKQGLIQHYMHRS
jgi:hypothetical protein